MKRIIKKYLPSGAISYYKDKKVRLSILRDYFYDYQLYLKHSSSTGLRKKEMVQAYLIKEYHSIEKGLALREPRPGFGLARITKFIDVLQHYVSAYKKDELVEICLSTLKEYADFDSKYNPNANALIPKIQNIVKNFEDEKCYAIGGTREVKKEDILRTLNLDFSSFFRSRTSTRDFNGEPVSTQLLLDAIELSRFTPSACNRQGWKVYLVEHDNQELKDKLLSVQNGNKGFGEYISSLLVVTGKISSFFDYERNQVYVDGGMFSMSLILALHAKGLGTCCLNTSYNADQLKKFSKVMKFDEDVVPIMLIGVGHLKETFKVAVSTRKPLGEIVHVESK